jgi:hypothetical protein
MESNENNAAESNEVRKSDGRKLASVCVYGNAVIFIGLAVFFFILPLIIMISALCDPGLRGESIPKIAFKLHQSLSPRYEKWARGRVNSDKAQKLDIEDISGTEWPMFGTAFYLLATESLQEAWEKDHSVSVEAPNVYAKGAIEQAAALAADTGNADWVKKHWGEDYLHKENTFYRMLLINCLTSHCKLLHDEKYIEIIRDQVNTLADEIDKSPHGWLDDYPNQCYPTDVLAAIAAINRADKVIGTDHSEFLKRAIRGFEGKNVSETMGLPTYEADSRFGIRGVVRGCSNAWGLISVPTIWPDTAKKWYASSEKYFWQSNQFVCGFREFPNNGKGRDWYFDVDSGPVLAGLGAAASAFGIGASRANGRFDHAFPVSAELIAMSCPLPNGTLFLPKLLSNSSDAPHLGEASILFILTRMPADGIATAKGEGIPLLVYLVLFIYAAIAMIMVLATRSMIRRWRKNDQIQLSFPNAQFGYWLVCLFASAVLMFLGNGYVAVLVLLLGQFVPQTKKIKNSKPANTDTGGNIKTAIQNQN